MYYVEMCFFNKIKIKDKVIELYVCLLKSKIKTVKRLTGVLFNNKM